MEGRTSLEGAQADVELLHLIAGQQVGDPTNPAMPKPAEGSDLFYAMRALVEDLKVHCRSLQQLAGKQELPADQRLLALRAWLMAEELGESVKAMKNGDEVEALDGFIDQLVVIIGTGVSFGFDLEAAWQEVQKSNLAKFPQHEACGGQGCDGCNGMGAVPILKDGKFQKPEGWQKPDIAGVLARQRAAKRESAGGER